MALTTQSACELMWPREGLCGRVAGIAWRLALTWALGLSVSLAPGPLRAQSVQALQADDALNPGQLWVRAGQLLWRQVPTSSGTRSCEQCHGSLATSMQGVAARYPRFSEPRGAVVSLADQIQVCRVQRQGAARVPRDHEALLQLETALAHASRGSPWAPDQHPQTQALADRGQALFGQRMGQLDLSCAQCHDQRAGRSLGGSLIPKGDPTGYPVYRLAWQSVGSLTRRLRGCLVGVRAEPFAPDDSAWLALETYLVRRAAGQIVDAPAIRP
jgi:L-cysteine S-thiosulfotransferase